jgi:hypothetical protein
MDFSPPDDSKDWRLDLEITTGSSIETIKKFYLTEVYQTSGKESSFTTGASLQIKASSISAIAYIGIVPGSTLKEDEFITVSAIDVTNSGTPYFTRITVGKKGGGGGSGGGGGTPTKPEDKTNPTPAKPGAGTGGQSSLPFNDVKTGDWFYSDVEYVLKNNLFTGVSATSFAPNTPMTRGMIVTVLGRLAGANTSATSSSFTDVAAGQYYTAYVEWAKANGLVNGVGGNRFAPDREVSRQDFAVILLRYTEFAKKPLPTARQPIAFADEATIADYAKKAVQVLYSSAIINGMDKNAFAPAKSATRAEVAAMLHRFVEATK